MSCHAAAQTASKWDMLLRLRYQSSAVRLKAFSAQKPSRCRQVLINFFYSGPRAVKGKWFFYFVQSGRVSVGNNLINKNIKRFWSYKNSLKTVQNFDFLLAFSRVFLPSTK
jgi:hypothetical protein